MVFCFIWSKILPRFAHDSGKMTLPTTTPFVVSEWPTEQTLPALAALTYTSQYPSSYLLGDHN